MSKGIDFAWGTLDIPAFVKYRGWVARYLCPLGQGKQITPAEAERYKEARLPFVVVWEDGADNALNGSTQGRLDGSRAAQQASALGMPTDRPIFISFDFDVQMSQLPVVLAYAKAFEVAAGDYLLGAYGSTYIIAALQRAGIVSFGWQCESTGYRSDPTAIIHIKQTGTGGNSWGVSYDDDISLVDDFGQWYPGYDPSKKPAPPIIIDKRKVDGMFGVLALNETDEFDAVIRVMWPKIRKDNWGEYPGMGAGGKPGDIRPVLRLFWKTPLPAGAGGNIDLVMAKIIDDANTKNVAQPDYVHQF